MDGWKTIVSFWDGLFSVTMLVSGSVSTLICATVYPVIFTASDHQVRVWHTFQVVAWEFWTSWYVVYRIIYIVLYKSQVVFSPGFIKTTVAQKESQSEHPNWHICLVFFGHPNGTKNMLLIQWSFLVPLIGGRDYIIPQKAIYKWYISGIYCQLGDYILPTTY